MQNFRHDHKTFSNNSDIAPDSTNGQISDDARLSWRWRSLLARLSLPAVRLHRYRNASGRMLGDAFGRLDCCSD